MSTSPVVSPLDVFSLATLTIQFLTWLLNDILGSLRSTVRLRKNTTNLVSVSDMGFPLLLPSLMWKGEGNP